MKDLIIVCAGSMGREVLQMVRHINRISPTWNVLGFLSDIPDALDGYDYEEKIIGTIQDWNITDNQYFALAIAEPVHKKAITEKLVSKGARFATIIHPSAIVSDTAKISEGCIIYWNLTIGPDCKIGKFCTLMSTVGHDSKIDDYSTICANCSTNGHFRMGKMSYIGSNACFVPGLIVGDNAKVGMGSVVLRNVKDNTEVFGNPAKKIDF